MPEQKRKLNTYKVNYLCDHCGEGLMIAGNVTLTSIPPQYPHICEKCGHRETFFERYPAIRYMTADED